MSVESCDFNKHEHISNSFSRNPSPHYLSTNWSIDVDYSIWCKDVKELFGGDNNMNKQVKQELADTQQVITVELLGVKKNDIKVSRRNDKVCIDYTINIGDKKIDNTIEAYIDNFDYIDIDIEPTVKLENNVLTIYLGLKDRYKKDYLIID